MGVLRALPVPGRPVRSRPLKKLMWRSSVSRIASSSAALEFISEFHTNGKNYTYSIMKRPL